MVDKNLTGRLKKKTPHNLMGKSLSEEKNHPGMFLISCKVKPNARSNRIYIDDAQVFVDITSPPVKGKANVAITRLFHNILHIRRSDIQLIRGQTSQQKSFRIWAPNLTCEKIRQLISEQGE